VSFAGYALVVATILGASLGTLFLLPASRLDTAARNAAVLGALLAAANTLLAFFLAVWSEPRATKAFFVAVLGGMGLRMGLMLGAVVAAILALGLPSLPLAVSLLGHFALFLALELTLLHRRTSRRS
jgi:branched-subunit amino acid ABC-type transport system permease component